MKADRGGQIAVRRARFVDFREKGGNRHVTLAGNRCRLVPEFVFQDQGKLEKREDDATRADGDRET